ncbi:uncharacterized protein LOC129611022 [Condylostylus longicornis]|uniref:uncharacterized protein LOC129611022 n=1 Tax=Condylostylus longicornis TaxID=2530218 RepID=UPI00244E2C9E|nr:uncharacterized protein LOC129611022 [Condylostylus longicornis]
MLAFDNKNRSNKRLTSTLSSLLLLLLYYNIINKFILKTIDYVGKIYKIFQLIILILIINQITTVIIIVEATVSNTSNMINFDGNIDNNEVIKINNYNTNGVSDSDNTNNLITNDNNNYGNMMSQSPLSSSTSSNDMLFIRHGRSRVRHSNEKDHIRWGLQAFDNLTLDYDIDAYDNDSIIINTGNGNFLFGSDLWALTDNNGSNYFNQTSLLFNTNINNIQKSRGYQSYNENGNTVNEYGNANEDYNNKILHQQQNSIIPTVQLQYSIPTQSPSLTTTFPKKKLRKKKIMENIKKNVDKGLEYLKSHKDLDEENLKLPIPVVVVEIKQSIPQSTMQLQQQKLSKDDKLIFKKHLRLKKKKHKTDNNYNVDFYKKGNIYENVNDSIDSGNDDDDGGDSSFVSNDDINNNNNNNIIKNKIHDNSDDNSNDFQNDSPTSNTDINSDNSNSEFSFHTNLQEKNMYTKTNVMFLESNEEPKFSENVNSNSNSNSDKSNINSKSTINSSKNNKKLLNDNNNDNDRTSQRIERIIKENGDVNENKEISHRIIHHPKDKENVNFDVFVDSSMEYQQQEPEHREYSRKHSHKQSNISPSHNVRINNGNGKQGFERSENVEKKNHKQGYGKRSHMKVKEENNNFSSFNSYDDDQIINNSAGQQYAQQQKNDQYYLQEHKNKKHSNNDEVSAIYENNPNSKEEIIQHKKFENGTDNKTHLNPNSYEGEETNLTIIKSNVDEMKESEFETNVKSFNSNQFESSTNNNRLIVKNNVDDFSRYFDDTDNYNNNKNENKVINTKQNHAVFKDSEDNHHKNEQTRQQNYQLSNNNNQKLSLSDQNTKYNLIIANSKVDASNNVNYKLDVVEDKTIQGFEEEHKSIKDGNEILYYHPNNEQKNIGSINSNSSNRSSNNNNDNKFYHKDENNKNHKNIDKYDEMIYDTMNDETFTGDTNINSDQDTILFDDDGIGTNVGGIIIGSGGTSDDSSIELNSDLELDTKYPGTVKPDDNDNIDNDDYDDISRKNRLNLVKGRDVVTKFLQIVETQHLLGANCKAGTALNLGEGVVDRYAQDRFRVEAEVAVNRANMLTRIFKNTSPEIMSSEPLLHASVLSMVAFDDDIFAAGHCFDWDQHPSKSGLFCPFAYRLPPPDQGAILAKDLALEYHYLGNTSEWFFQARKNAENVIARNDQFNKAFHLYSNSTVREEDEILAVKYEDGRWSKPYYDCGGGNIWMLTYTVPFFGYDHENITYFFKGTSGIDIDLRRVDIDQCPQRYVPGTTTPLNIFAGTDKCKQRTTMCLPIPGLGFRRGSYKCVCRKGFYYPDTTASQKYFNGSVLEEEYEKLMLGDNSTYSKPFTYECLPCAEGCDYCEDASPCVAALNWPMRTSILVLACAVIGFLPPAAWFTFRYQQVKVVRAASPALLRVIALGAFFIYCTTIVMYPHPSLYTCTARVWLREIGFSLTYGALMLKTWRISVIFRVRSAKAVKITDAALLKRLGVICGVIGACLLVRTIVSPPEVVVGRTADDLKAFLCKTDWWDYTFTSMEVLFLAWGVRLCIMVRKAPSEFNESRFISMAIYNEFLLTCFLNVSMLFLQSPANPDLLFIIFFCHTQLTVTLLLGLIFGSKVYIVLRSGKSQEAIAMGGKQSGAKFNFRPQIRTFANPSTSTSTAQMHTADTKLSDQEALEEIRQLSYQLQRIQESAPPKGIAVMTISSLLDSLRTTSQQLNLVTKSTTASNTGTNATNNNIGSLSIFAVNDIQKFAQNNNSTPAAATVGNTQKQVTIIEKTTKTIAVEKSINTSLTGDEFLNKINSEKTDSEPICSNCAKTISKVSSCNQIDSPSNKNILSFSNLKLECMCSESVDDFNERQAISISTKQSPIRNITTKIEQNNQLYNFNSPQPPTAKVTEPAVSSVLTVRTSSSLKLQKELKSPIISTSSIYKQNSNSLMQLPQLHSISNQQSQLSSNNHQHQKNSNLYQQTVPKSSTINSSNLKTSKTIDEISISLTNVAQKLEAHSLKLGNNIKANSKCDNQNKLIETFLICDNCKKKLIIVNNEKIMCNNNECSEFNRIISLLNEDPDNRNLSTTSNKIKSKVKDSRCCNNINNNNSNNNSNGSKNNGNSDNSSNLINSKKCDIELNIVDSGDNTTQQSIPIQYAKRKLSKTLIHHDDDISFHSTDDSSCYGDDCTADGGISEGSILASAHYNVKISGNDEIKANIMDSDSPILLHISKSPPQTGSIVTPSFDDNDSVHNINLCDESGKSITGSCSGNEENIITASSTSISIHSKDLAGDCADNGAGGCGGSSGDCIASSNNSSVKKRKTKNDKLVLDLNDRTKYTKEVSV